MAEGRSNEKIRITVKTPKEKQAIEIDGDADIKEVSSYVCNVFIDVQVMCEHICMYVIAQRLSSCFLVFLLKLE